MLLPLSSNSTCLFHFFAASFSRPYLYCWFLFHFNVISSVILKLIFFEVQHIKIPNLLLKHCPVITFSDCILLQPCSHSVAFAHFNFLWYGDHSAQTLLTCLLFVSDAHNTDNRGSDVHWNWCLKKKKKEKTFLHLYVELSHFTN